MLTLKKGGPVWTVLRWYGYTEVELLYSEVSLCKAFWSIMLGLVVFWPARGFWRVLKAFGRLLGKILLPILVWIFDEKTTPWQTFVRLEMLIVIATMATTAITRNRDSLIVGGVLMAISWYVGGLVWLSNRLQKRKLQTNPRRPSALSEGFAVVRASLGAAKQRACPRIKFVGPGA